ncbi:MAG: hypothetical protein GWN01_00905 [Nitrosopumilaceae archaeon]|nr:hypothetical protein [Nitrosopumilaceae archaeon]NIT99537.1 hypothetical protein [Nitrosopumilaceae archaeon]NIU85912.1 hypothetical protein [Nitrosopumilaceae archaeon]NIV64746.1 hypothetical protein [Nitrosopumilaceae archaeon]NIX60140.1 hypothetical protein [Nitrosopumilaceae archaeon]
MKLRVLQVGFGSLGKQICKEILPDNRFKILQIIDKNPSLKGLDPGKPFKIKTKFRIQNELKNSKPDVIIHSTISKISDAYEQFKDLARYKSPILSTCEELVYPTKKNNEIAQKIDRLAVKNQIPILGIGVNPGYLMDSLVLSLSNLFLDVKSIKVSRTVDLSKRRKALQEKMFVGKRITQFKSHQTSLGHVGLEESATMICDHFKIKPTIRRTLYPILAKRKLNNKFFDVKKGDVIGISEKLLALNRKKVFLKMNLDMHLGAEDIDSISINGSHSVKFQTSGVNGDKATIAILLNHIQPITNQGSGLFVVDGTNIRKFDPKSQG